MKKVMNVPNLYLFGTSLCCIQDKYLLLQACHFWELQQLHRPLFFLFYTWHNNLLSCEGVVHRSISTTLLMRFNIVVTAINAELTNFSTNEEIN